MANIFRISPPVCFGISLFRLISGKLKYSKQYLDHSINMTNGNEFSIFRHITTHPILQDSSSVVFIVSFKFAHLSHNSNKFVSIIPMLFITGFPGFMAKIYAVNNTNGYWQGMYQWKSMKHLEDYKKSLVFRIMNKRATSDSISSNEFAGKQLNEFIESIKKY